MADELVRRAQRWINSYSVPGIPKVEEDGRTRWSVMYALTRILQYELGISPLSDSFGPTTINTLQSRFPSIDGQNTHGNINRVVQSGLYCKGYDGGEIDGSFNSRVSTAATQLKRDMGVDGVYPGDGITPKVFKALLTMDPYVVVGDGTELIASVQRWMNSRYVGRRNFFIIPCDGSFSRDVQKSLLLAIQFQIGMSDDAANGVFGPGTRDGIRNNPISVGSTGTWVQLFNASMIFNRRPGVGFSSTFDSALADRVREFQSFVKLPVNGRGDYQTWASLLVSTGDATRAGTACDCVDEITYPRADALRAAGYTTVGRYLTNVPGSSLNKMIRPNELTAISSSGLSAFPIYQTYGGAASYFSTAQGRGDGFSAIEAARYHGFKPGTRIYFAVDFDALDYQVTDNIIPHFRGIKTVLDEHGPEYLIGIYGPRNVCSRVAQSGLTSASFVSDMSTGFSGNLGYPMPADWAFDQISTITVGSGNGSIQIDNNIASGRDPGQRSFNAGLLPLLLDVDFDMTLRSALLADVRAYLESIGVPESGGPGTDFAQIRSTAESFDITMQFDSLITRLARSLRIRKSLIQCPLLWELRKLNVDDPASDAAVIDHYAGSGASPVKDSSTGLAQIFAATAIRSRNFCISAGRIGGVYRDPTSEADLWEIWKQLHYNDDYNVGTVPIVLIEGAHDIGLRSLAIDFTEDEHRRTLARYNGTGPDAENYGFELIGLYRVFEKYNAPLR